MFDQSLEYKLIQIRSNKHHTNETFTREHIYRFYRHNERCCIKYIVSVKEYHKELLTLDYYPKINLTPKSNTVDNIQDLRYRMLTKQNAFGIIGGTILDIMQEVENKTALQIWGFLAASLPTETTNSNNKRYNIYKEVLSRTFRTRHKVFGNRDNSAIFVIPTNLAAEAQRIIEDYEYIFSETN
ncbi:MAG TPA: hypothetical protein DIT07_08850 [Sphingobacteriaceae bacterium]|nr:hypothetical protein [Sphingobacteriaceae bacterium]